MADSGASDVRGGDGRFCWSRLKSFRLSKLSAAVWAFILAYSAFAWTVAALTPIFDWWTPLAPIAGGLITTFYDLKSGFRE
jgi:hypothetical protein